MNPHYIGMKKCTYITLASKKTSSFYNKNDLWVVSKTMDFQPGSTFIARSHFYGPSSNGDLEILPLASFSGTNWSNGEVVS